MLLTCERADRQVMLPVILALTFAAFFTIGTGQIAGRKGRNPVAWSMVGLFLGIFGMLLAVALRPKKPAFES
jgi:hypothetical protein